MGDAWTIRRVLEWTAKDFSAKGIGTPRLDAELLVARALGVKRVGLYLDLDRPLAPKELSEIRALVQRRRRREPVAYILGQRDFYGRTFEVSPAVLIPRPDTETLVECALQHLDADAEARVLDVGTGSGILAVSIALQRPQAHVEATDRSGEALEVARRNAERHGVEPRVSLHAGDLYEAVAADAQYALIVSNPPYIPEQEFDALAPEITDHEPRQALAAGPDGMAVHARIVAGAPAHLVSGGWLLLEVGEGQAQAVAGRMREAGLDPVEVHRDLAGTERVVAGCRP